VCLTLLDTTASFKAQQIEKRQIFIGFYKEEDEAWAEDPTMAVWLISEILQPHLLFQIESVVLADLNDITFAVKGDCDSVVEISFSNDRNQINGTSV